MDAKTNQNLNTNARTKEFRKQSIQELVGVQAIEFSYSLPELQDDQLHECERYYQQDHELHFHTSEIFWTWKKRVPTRIETEQNFHRPYCLAFQVLTRLQKETLMTRGNRVDRKNEKIMKKININSTRLYFFS